MVMFRHYVTAAAGVAETGMADEWSWLQTGTSPPSAILKGVALFALVIWTVAANSLVFVVLYKNPRLQTVPNLLVGNLALSDLCLGLVVLPLSSVYAIAGQWLFSEPLCVVFVSADILCSTASIWNLSIVGLDRYWAITSPVAYMAKRTKRTALLMILAVWLSSALISLAPMLGWKQMAAQGNLVRQNGTWQCTFLDLPSYTVYSATGSFFIPVVLMFFVYAKIYQAFARHRARQIYRQKLAASSQVIRKHIESTILHEISHVLPTSDEFAKENDEDEEEDEMEESSSSAGKRLSKRTDRPQRIEEEDEGEGESEDEEEAERENERPTSRQQAAKASVEDKDGCNQNDNNNCHSASRRPPLQKSLSLRQTTSTTVGTDEEGGKPGKHGAPKRQMSAIITFDKVQRHKMRKERVLRSSLQRKPNAISAAKEKRGVKVLGVILGCFACCWTPFFIMYVVVQFCTSCIINPHVEMFITWLGYSNSALNPIIYTVFNRDYQIALKKLFSRSTRASL